MPIKDREEKIRIMETYKEKEYIPGKCKMKYFMDGFLNAFNIIKWSSGDMQKFCPHCCEKISRKEYFEDFGLFTYGCKSCREKK